MVVIVLNIEGDRMTAYDAVNASLDAGTIQDDVNGFSGDDDKSVQVIDAIMFAGDKDAVSNLRDILKHGHIGRDKFLP